MSLALSPVVGTIHIEPLVQRSPRRASPADDSTLGALLSELAHCERLEGEEPVRLVASARLSCFGIGPERANVSVRADLVRLLEDLQAEYDELGLPC